MIQNNERKGIFLSYSHQDSAWLTRLQVHLKPLERDYYIEIWDDTKIRPGAKWKEEIERAIRSAKVAVLLVSADFLASDFVISNELPPLLEAAERAGAGILPIILSPCRFSRTSMISKFQAINDPLRPLVDMTRGEQEAVLARVSDIVEDLLDSRQQNPPTANNEPEPTANYCEELPVTLSQQNSSFVAHAPVQNRSLVEPLQHACTVSPPTNAAWVNTWVLSEFSAVYSVAFSPDGRLLASGHSDGSVILWKIPDGELSCTLMHGGLVNSVAFSPDGKTLASGGNYTSVVRLWNVAAGRPRDTLILGPDPRHHVNSLAFSPDGSMLASAREDGVIEVWTMRSGTLRWKLNSGEYLSSVAFSRDGKTLAAGSRKGATVWLFNTESGTLSHELATRQTNVLSLAFSPDGDTLAIGANWSATLWDIHKNRLRQKPLKLNGYIRSLAFSPDGCVLASAGKEVEVCDIKTGESQQSLGGHIQDVYSVDFSPDGSILASGSFDETIILWKRTYTGSG